MASDASETLVLDQCALFALRCAVGAAQDREVSSQEIIGALGDVDQRLLALVAEHVFEVAHHLAQGDAGVDRVSFRNPMEHQSWHRAGCLTSS